MIKKKTKVAIITNVIPHYRAGFYKRLFALEDISVKVYCQATLPNSGIKLIHDQFADYVHLMSYKSISGETVVWQFIPYKKIYQQYDVVFIIGNPRYLSQAIYAIGLKLLGKKVVIWGMVHSYKNNNFTEWLRLQWFRFFDSFLVYTNHGKNKLLQAGFKNKQIFVMNNGLDQQQIDRIAANWTKDKLLDWQKLNSIADRTIILSSGRLINNKFGLLMDAMPFIKKSIPNILWVIIGDGEDRICLSSQMKKNQLSDHVRFAGALFEESELAPWFLSSKLLVHPAPIGLTLNHAFGYGLPIITHDEEERHGPEYALFENGKTGVNYKNNNLESLINATITLLQDDKLLEKMKSNVITIVRTNHNVDVMVDRFVQAVVR